MLKYFIQWIKEEGYKILIPFFIVLIILIMVILPWLKEKEEETKDTLQSSLSTPQVSSSISVVPKEKPSDPDLKVTQKYTAQINNKTVEIPLSKPKETLSPDGQTVVVSQTVDMTAAVKPMLPRWSVGVGIGKDRIQIFLEAWGNVYDQYFDALKEVPETDYYREMLDKRLKMLYAVEHFEPFEERYQFLPEMKY